MNQRRKTSKVQRTMSKLYSQKFDNIDDYVSNLIDDIDEGNVFDKIRNEEDDDYTAED